MPALDRVEAMAQRRGHPVALVVTPHGARSLSIREDRRDGPLAVLYVPERLADTAGDLMLHGNALDAIPAQGAWSSSGSSLRYEARSPEEILRFEPFRGRRPLYEKPRTARDPVSLVVEATPRDSGVGFRLAVTNEGPRELRGVEASICLRFADPDFRDLTGARTFLVDAEKRLPAAGFPTTTAVPRHRWIRSASTDAPGPPPAGERFWGTALELDTPPAAITRSDDQAPRETWLFVEGARSWQTNLSREINCIHANPFFASIPPGQTVVREGRILLLRRASNP